MEITVGKRVSWRGGKKSWPVGVAAIMSKDGHLGWPSSQHTWTSVAWRKQISASPPSPASPCPYPADRQRWHSPWPS